MVSSTVVDVKFFSETKLHALGFVVHTVLFPLPILFNKSSRDMNDIYKQMQAVGKTRGFLFSRP